jgi:type II secretory pathway component PulM
LVLSLTHSLLIGEEKQRESAERALEEERKRAAELQNQLHNEQRLRAEVETKLEHANRDVHEKVAKVHRLYT